MPEILVGRVDEFDEHLRVIIELSPTSEVCVLRAGDQFYAYSNKCLHQGGPVCEGIVIGKVLAVFDDENRSLGRRFSQEELHIVCPWHGWEYDLRSGECVAERNLALRKYPVRIEDGQVYVVV